MRKEKKGGIYARFSGHKQSESSIDDQVRRTREGLESEGYTVDEEHIYFDKAVSVSGGVTAKQVAFKKCWKALQNGEFDVLVVDELSRLGRNMRDIINRVEEAHSYGVEIRSVMNDFKSKRPDSIMLLAVFAALAQMETTQISFRTNRGMMGALERGGMCGYPPMGYVMGGVTVPGQGATWKIHDEQASVVREMFEMRAAGKSFGSIAKELNSRGLIPPKRKLTDRGGYWRAATVDRILSNTIYKGVFTWNSSGYAKSKAKKEKRVLTPVEYLRPQLQLVSEELWLAANPTKKEAVRGFKHSLTRLVSCGYCGNCMTVKKSKSATCLYCSVCFEEAKQKDGPRGMGHYTSVKIISKVLEDSISRLCSLDELQIYKKRLLKLNEGDIPLRISALDHEIGLLKNKIKGIEDFLLDNSERYKDYSLRLADLRTTLNKSLATRSILERSSQLIDTQKLNEHLESVRSSYSQLTSKVILECSSPEEMNKLLRKLAPSITVLKTSKFSWEVTVRLSPAAELIGAFEDEVVQNTHVVFKYWVRKHMSPFTHYDIQGHRCEDIELQA